MNFKNFFIASLIIHILGAIALYFYYNPITVAPQPVKVFKEEQKRTEITPKAKKVQKVKSVRKSRKKALFPPPENSDQNRFHSKKNLGENKAVKKEEIVSVEQDLTDVSQSDLNPEEQDERQADLDSEDEEVDSISIQEQALFEAEDPLPEVKAAPAEVTDSSELNLEEIKEESESLDPDTQLEEDFKKMTVEGDDSEGIETDLSAEEEEEFTKMEVNFPAEGEEDFTEIETGFSAEEEENFKEKETGSLSDEGDFKEIKTSSLSDTEDFTESLKTQISKVDIKEGDFSSTNEAKSFSSLKQKRGNPSLSYPDFARRDGGMQGTVSVLFFVTEQGLVEKIQLTSSSGHSDLDNFVLRTLGRYEFLPGQESWVRHKISFILEGEEVERLRLRHE